MTTIACPACGAKGVPAVATWAPHGKPRREAHGTCGTCGWDSHAVPLRRNWCAPEHLPGPRDMGAEEFAFRAHLFCLWKTRPASELVSQFRIFADWLADRGRAEEVAARADWQPYAAKKADPVGWYQWTVPAGKGWVSLETVEGELWATRRYIVDDKAKLTRSYHNGRWWLCWPPGFCRITGTSHQDIRRWRVTLQPNRALLSSKPIEKVWPGGYTTLLMDRAAPPAAPVGGVLRPSEEDTPLFAEVGDVD